MLNVWDIPKIDAVLELGHPDDKDRESWKRIKEELTSHKSTISTHSKMTLDEAISHCEEKAKSLKNIDCINEHTQLAKWLKELKALKNIDLVYLMGLL